MDVSQVLGPKRCSFTHAAVDISWALFCAPGHCCHYHCVVSCKHSQLLSTLYIKRKKKKNILTGSRHRCVLSPLLSPIVSYPLSSSFSFHFPSPARFAAAGRIGVVAVVEVIYLQIVVSRVIIIIIIISTRLETCPQTRLDPPKRAVGEHWGVSVCFQ